MKSRGLSNTFSIRHTGLCLMLLASAIFPTSGRAETSGNFLPQFQFSADSDEPIITYTLTHHMLANPDPTPLLRVYGNGKVHAHYPGYMKNSGDYQLQLSRPELIELLHTLAQNGVLDFDHKSASLFKKQIDTQQRLVSGTMYHVSDTTETVIDIKLDTYQSNPSARRIENFSKRFTWNNLEQDAKRYTNSAAITRASASAQKLHLLLDQSRSTNIQ
jgi:hypothetical protein